VVLQETLAEDHLTSLAFVVFAGVTQRTVVPLVGVTFKSVPHVERKILVAFVVFDPRPHQASSWLFLKHRHEM